MKKGLLLSVVASTMIFAGGDIAPVEPAAPASADFWGQIGFSYDANDFDWGPWTAGLPTSLGDTENNAFSTSIVLGVEKELGYGFGFGFEVAGWTDFGLDIADLARVSGEITPWGSRNQTDAEVSQAYLTYTFGNTAIKAGRQALPAAVSPWAWSDRSAGVLDITYDALVVANTDLQDTTIVGAWVANAVNGNSPTHLGDNDAGIFMLAAINKSLANTTLTVSGYYFADAAYDIPNIGKVYTVPVGMEDLYSIWASAVGNMDGITWGLQGAYVDGSSSYKDATFAIAGKVGSTWGDFDATLVASYINDGDYSLKTAGSGVGTSAFWGNSFGGTFTNGDGIGKDGVTHVRVDMGYKLSTGKLFGGIGYVDYGSKWLFDNGFGGRIGYKFNVMGVNSKVEYRYADYSGQNGVPDLTKQRIRVEAFYKF